MPCFSLFRRSTVHVHVFARVALHIALHIVRALCLCTHVASLPYKVHDLLTLTHPAAPNAVNAYKGYIVLVVVAKTMTVCTGTVLLHGKSVHRAVGYIYIRGSRLLSWSRTKTSKRFSFAAHMDRQRLSTHRTIFRCCVRV